MEATAFYEIVV